jgi:hypothetical protein
MPTTIQIRSDKTMEPNVKISTISTTTSDTVQQLFISVGQGFD